MTDPVVLKFPADRRQESNPITDENVALSNSLIRTLNAWFTDHPDIARDDQRELAAGLLATITAWLTEHPHATREALEWAIAVAGDAVAEADASPDGVR